MVCLDVGCGGGDVTLELAHLVGAEGKVVGIDMDAIKLEFAQQEANQQQLSNIAFRTQDVHTLDEEAMYDIVYARFLLTHLTDPQNVVARMFRAVKPGGAVVLEDIEHSGVFCYPECSALERYVHLYNQVVRSKGADPDIGPKLPTFLRKAGFEAIQLNLVHPVFMTGEGKTIHQLTLENIAQAVIAAGMASQAEIDMILTELAAFADDPHTLMSLPRIFQVWAYRS
jgi:ubiquinone/menaquinone biosynthesis C-methylase UbiE